MELLNAKTSKEVPTFKKMSVKAIARTLIILQDVCKTVDGCAFYKQGNNDATVAEQVNLTEENATENGVARIRKEMYGNLKTGGSIPQNNVDRLEKCERACKRFCEAMGLDWEQI